MIEVRPAVQADVPHVLPMVAQVCAFHEQLDPAKYGFLPEPQRRYERWLGERAVDSRSVFFVAEDAPGAGKRRLVGFIVGTVEREIPIYRISEYGFLHDLWVSLSHRQQGIGRKLAEAAIARFREMGVPQIRLDTAAANEPARRLFMACGFRASIIEMIHELTD